MSEVLGGGGGVRPTHISTIVTHHIEHETRRDFYL